MARANGGGGDGPGGRGRRFSTGVTPTTELQANIEREEAAAAAEQRVDDHAALRDGRPLVDRYPERLMPIAGAQIDWADDHEAQAVRARYEAFCDVREAALKGYGFNTARAYWGDLEDIFWWAERRGFDACVLDGSQLKQYQALLRRRRYSPNTARRRLAAWRSLVSKVVEVPFQV